MALTFTNDGSGNSTTSTATLAVTSTLTYAVGDMVVVCIAADNNGASGASSISSVTDSKSHTYTQRRIDNADPGAAAAGQTSAIYTTTVTTAMTTSDVITANFSPNTTSKAMVIYRVVGSSTEFPVYLSNGGVTGTTANPSLTSTSITNGDTVFYSLARESNAAITADSDATNGSWSTNHTATASTGTVATSSMVSSQRKTVTATATQTYNVTAVASDWALSYIVLNPKAIPQRTATGGGTGTETSTGARAVVKTATGSGTGTESTTGLHVSPRTATGSGTSVVSMVIESQTSSNDGYYDNVNDTVEFFGNSFLGTGLRVASASFRLKRTGTPTGNAVLKIYSHTGTYGSTGVGSTLLATSDGVLASTINDATPTSTDFTFSGDNAIILTSGTPYVIGLVCVGADDITNWIDVYQSVASASTGNMVAKQGVSWSYNANHDCVFSVTSAEAFGLVLTATSRTATGSGTGTQSSTGLLTSLRTATGGGTGTQSATGLETSIRTATGSGTGTESATGIRLVIVTATGSGAGSQTSTGLRVSLRTATGSGTGTESADGGIVHAKNATGSGVGAESATGLHVSPRTATGAGVGSATATGFGASARTATGSGTGSATSTGVVIIARTATGDGAGTESSTEFILYAYNVEAFGYARGGRLLADSEVEGLFVGLLTTSGEPYYPTFIGQTIVGDGRKIASVEFLVSRNTTITGDAYAQVWSNVGGVIDTLLATSDPYPASSIFTDDPHKTEFIFSGADQIVLTNAADYIVGFTCPSIGLGEYVALMLSGALAHPGNVSVYGPDNGTEARPGEDLVFSLFVVEPGASGLHISPRTATGSGVGTETSDGGIVHARTATGSGLGTGTADGGVSYARTATSSGVGTGTSTGLHISPRTSTGSGVGSATASAFITFVRTSSGSGTGSESSSSGLLRTRTATGSGTGSNGTVSWTFTAGRIGTGTGTGTSSATGLPTAIRSATGLGIGSEISLQSIKIEGINWASWGFNALIR